MRVFHFVCHFTPRCLSKTLNTSEDPLLQAFHLFSMKKLIEALERCFVNDVDTDIPLACPSCHSMSISTRRSRVPMGIEILYLPLGLLLSDRSFRPAVSDHSNDCFRDDQNLIQKDFCPINVSFSGHEENNTLTIVLVLKFFLIIFKN